MTRTNNLLLALCCLALVAGCSRADGAPSAAPAKKVQSGRVARIGFIDLERCCACTRTRIDATWKTLMEVLGFPPTIPLGPHDERRLFHSLNMLCPRHASVRSPLTLSIPRRRNLLMPLFSLMLPKQHSTILLRMAKRACPSSVRSLAAISSMKVGARFFLRGGTPFRTSHVSCVATYMSTSRTDCTAFEQK